ncbi:MAG: hypothetical protein JSW54_11200 [Fidelibacterota bacterium]|nr:MAG: hypothetical protein JSW54_11200 [Candidatus Neomarinimicrobiota bacterium]
MGDLLAPFHSILFNRTDGASALFEQFIQIARHQTRDVVVAGLQACQDAFPLMAVWSYALVQVTQHGHELEQTAAEMAQQTVGTFGQGARIIEHYHTILTLSNSSLVRRAVLSVSGPIQVLCALSLPGEEGRELAAALNKAGIQATLVADDQLSQRLSEIEAIVLGADQYDNQGFVNKIGSGSLARLAEQSGMPVWVLAEEFKRVPQLPELTPESAALELEFDGQVSRHTVFERVSWQPHIKLITNASEEAFRLL